MFIQKDIKIITYAQFEGEKYYNGDLVEIEYENGVSKKGFLNIYGDCIVVNDIPNHPHYHSFSYPERSDIKNIKLLERNN